MQESDLLESNQKVTILNMSCLFTRLGTTFLLIMNIKLAIIFKPYLWTEVKPAFGRTVHDDHDDHEHHTYDIILISTSAG